MQIIFLLGPFTRYNTNETNSQEVRNSLMEQINILESLPQTNSFEDLSQTNIFEGMHLLNFFRKREAEDKAKQKKR